MSEINSTYSKLESVKILGSTPESQTIKVLFSKDDLKTFEKRWHSIMYSVEMTTKQVMKLTGEIPEVVDKDLVIESSQGQRTVKVVRHKEELRLEVWNETGFESSHWLGDIKTVYNHSVFGGLQWSKSGSKVAFISEKPTPKFIPFWSDDTDGESNYDKYHYE